MEPIWLFKMFIAHFHPLLFYRIKSLVFPVPCHQTTILRTQRPYFHKMTTALVEALYLKLFEIQCFPAFSISSCWYYYFTIQHLSGSDCIYQKRSQQFIHTLLTSYTTHFIYFAASQTSFHFKHNLCFPASLLHTT